MRRRWGEQYLTPQRTGLLWILAIALALAILSTCGCSEEPAGPSSHILIDQQGRILRPVRARAVVHPDGRRTRPLAAESDIVWIPTEDWF